MSSPAIITPWNFRPFQQGVAVTDAKGMPSSAEVQIRTNLQKLLQSAAVANVATFGAQGNGRTDDTNAFQQAINQAISLSSQLGIGVVQIPSGTFMVNLASIPAGSPPIIIMGQGTSSIVKRNGNVAPGHGVFDIMASNTSLMDFVMDGATAAPKGLQYGHDFNGINGNDPYAASLTTNTSVWLHGGTTGFSCQGMTFQHAGGYSILLDATVSSISDVDIVGSTFINNRPTLFGTTSGQLIYGSWNGVILAKGDGRTANSGVVNDLYVAGCTFSRNNGNCLWSHSWGLNSLHTGFRFVGNSFLDCGLDGILVGAVTGGQVAFNFFRRVGYVTLNDTAQSIPRWLANLNATALDSAGVVKGVPYECNSFVSINGGCLDLDGHCFSCLIGNVCRLPYSYEIEYTQDQIAITGPNNNGSASYGVNTNNSSQTEEGCTNVEICGNQFINLPGGSMRLYAARRFHATSNNIEAPSNSVSPPISLGPVGAGLYQRCYDNKVTNNNIDYDTSVGTPPAVFEDDSISAFISSEQNTVYNNNPITPTGTTAIEFQKSSTSGSVVYSEQVWFP